MNEHTDIIPFHLWFEENKHLFPSYLQDAAYDNADYIYFLQHVYRKFMPDFTEQLKKLTYEHYPVFRRETRGKILNRIDNLIENAGYSLIFQAYELVQDQFAEFRIRDKYPEFELWKRIYTDPQSPGRVEENTRHLYSYYNELQWNEFNEKENRSYSEYYRWYQKRFNEFSRLLKSVLLKHYYKAAELNADENIMLVIHITDQYEIFKTECEQIELFIDCKFSDEDIELNFSKFSEKIGNLSPEILEHAHNLRKRRIFGEKI